MALLDYGFIICRSDLIKGLQLPWHPKGETFYATFVFLEYSWDFSPLLMALTAGYYLHQEEPEEAGVVEIQVLLWNSFNRGI
jgi:hypothetical protein